MQSSDALIAKHTFRKSYWEYRSFKADYLPSLSLSATLPSITRSFLPVASQNGTTSYTLERLANYGVSLNLNQKIGITGGSVYVNTGLQRMDNFLPGLSIRQYLSNVISVGFVQPLFSFNTYKWDKKIEPLKYKKARMLYLENEENVAITAVDYFFSVLTVQMQVVIAQKNYHNYSTLYEIAQKRYRLGKTSKIDLLQLQLNSLRADAELEQAKLNYKNKIFRLKSFLRIKDSITVLLVPAHIDYFKISPQSALEKAKTNTSSELEFKKQILNAKKQLEQAKHTNGFNMDINVSFGLSQTSKTFREAYTTPLDQEMVSLGINIPILDWGKTKGEIKMAGSNYDLVMSAVEQDKVDFEREVFLTVRNFAIQKKQIMIAAKSDTIARMRYQITYQMYLSGEISDLLVLINAQKEKDDARINFLNALKNYWEDYYEIRKLTLYDFESSKLISFDENNLLN